MSSAHQLGPYIGKMQPAMARNLVLSFSKPGDTVLDPFSGSGTIALEGALNGRRMIATDINPYAVTLTRGKLHPPKTIQSAISILHQRLAGPESQTLPPSPLWVRKFFHPRTLKEVLALVAILREHSDDFLMAALLAILHHQRPGFLSYPSSNVIPYLRTKKFPRQKFPELYAYRPVGPRLESKIQRVYRNLIPVPMGLGSKCLQMDASKLKFRAGSLDAVISSPPYMNALDYARDNRLRLWFLGVEEYKFLDQRLSHQGRFLKMMTSVIENIAIGLKSGGRCVLVIGETRRRTRPTNVARMIERIAVHETGKFVGEGIIEDEVPILTHGPTSKTKSKREWVVVLRRK